MLSERIQSEFRASGISDPMLQRAGVHAVDGREVSVILGWQPRAASWGSGWAIPFRDLDGADTGYQRIKLDSPRTNQKGKSIKYESPKGAANRAYFPPGLGSLMSDASQPILITEGEKKALSAAQLGFATIGLVGVWGWQDRRLRRSSGTASGPRRAIPDLARFQWTGRRVYLIFDSDAIQSVPIQAAERELACVLTGYGASVSIVRLPAPGSGKIGLDDFIVQYGASARAELKVLLDSACPPTGLAPVSSGFQIADRLLTERYAHADGWTVRYFRGEYYAWNGRCYAQVPRDDFELGVLEWLDREVGATRSSEAREACTCLAARCLVPATVEPPEWLDQRSGPATSLIALQNGLLNVERLLDGQTDVLHPHSPQLFSLNSLPFSFDPEADCRRWLSFLDEVLECDSERIGLLQQWFGYNLIADTSQHKFMVLVGEGANGKSVVLAVLAALLGERNVSRVPLEAFGSRFGLWPTLGKLANLIAEVGEATRTDEGIFKQFVAGDPVSVDRKHLSIIEVRPTARITIATNTMPRWSDRSEGVWRRQMIVPFRIHIPESRQDRGLAHRMVDSEAAGILNWALVGLGSLRSAGDFLRPSLSAEAQLDHRLDANPAKAFLTQECRWLPGSEIRSDALYRTYAEWSLAHGYRPLGDAEFGREIGRVYPESERSKRRVQRREVRFRTGISCPLAGVEPSAATSETSETSSSNCAEIKRVS